MNPEHIPLCRRWFLSELGAGAPPEMAAAFAGIADVSTVRRWRAEDPEFAAAWDRAAAEASPRETLPKPIGRPVEPCDIIGWLEARGGTARTNMRVLGAELGCSAAKVHARARRLAAAGALRVTPGSRSTLLELT